MVSYHPSLANDLSPDALNVYKKLQIAINNKKQGAKIMRIIIDMQGAQTESRFRGIGRYTMSLCEL